MYCLVVQYFQAGRDLAKITLRSFLGIVLLRNIEGKKEERRFYFIVFKAFHTTITALLENPRERDLVLPFN